MGEPHDGIGAPVVEGVPEGRSFEDLEDATMSSTIRKEFVMKTYAKRLGLVGGGSE